jgi:protein-S-isoprenylcysteine O-methyltransferase Ste14
MRRRSAAWRSAVFFAAAPGVVAGVGPGLITGWETSTPPPPIPVRVAGALLIAAGASFLVSAFVEFVVRGLGTPAPIAPTEHLVVSGVYRWVRNPMYLAVEATILGQALLLGQVVLLGYAAITAAAMASFARWYEEPALRRQFGAEYDRYRATVPGWLPRRPRRDRPGTTV